MGFELQIPNKIQFVKYKKQKGASFEAPSYFPKVTVQLLHCFLTVHDADLVVDGFVVDGF
jgi:hypothetical protein